MATAWAYQDNVAFKSNADVYKTTLPNTEPLRLQRLPQTEDFQHATIAQNSRAQSLNALTEPTTQISCRSWPRRSSLDCLHEYVALPQCRRRRAPTRRHRCDVHQPSIDMAAVMPRGEHCPRLQEFPLSSSAYKHGQESPHRRNIAPWTVLQTRAQPRARRCIHKQQRFQRWG